MEMQNSPSWKSTMPPMSWRRLKNPEYAEYLALSEVYQGDNLKKLTIGIGAYFFLQKSPDKQGGWLGEEERRFLVLRNRYTYGSDKSGNSDKLQKKDVIAALKSIHVWAMSIAYLAVGVAVYGLSFTLPTIMNNMGFTAATSQAMSTPPYVFASLCVLASGWYSDKYKQRTLSTVIPSVVAFAGLLICVLTVTHKHLVALAYIGVCLAAGGAYCLTPAYSAWAGLNSAGTGKRAVAISISVLWAQIGGVAGSNIFMAKESPAYHTGFGTCLAFVGFGNILVPSLYYFYVGYVNKQREKLSEEEVYAKWRV